MKWKQDFLILQNKKHIELWPHAFSILIEVTETPLLHLWPEKLCTDRIKPGEETKTKAQHPFPHLSSLPRPLIHQRLHLLASITERLFFFPFCQWTRCLKILKRIYFLHLFIPHTCIKHLLCAFHCAWCSEEEINMIKSSSLMGSQSTTQCREEKKDKFPNK